ncbi:MAG: zinc ribbon domain-containing protein [Eubacterium sp.]|nr:zinc ribbon domain-containing protein [Eubacterium sp.]
MFCFKCGNELPDSAAFCDKCGQKAEIKMINPTEAEVKQILSKDTVNKTQTGASLHAVHPKPKVIVIAAVTAAVLCVVLYLLFFVNRKNNSPQNGSLVLVYDSNQNITRIVYNDILLDDYLQGDENASSCESSLDGNTYAINTKDRTLYLIDGHGLKTVAYDVDDFSLSYNGGGMIYSDTEENVFMYDCVKKEKTKIANNNSNQILNLCISPDGQSAAYTEYSDGEYTMYSYAENEKNKVAKDMLPLAVSDNFVGCFAFDTSDSLYYIDDLGEKERVASSFAFKEFVLNKNNTEIIFYDGEWYDEGRYYYFSSDGEKVMLYDKISSLYDNNSYNLPCFICPNNTLCKNYTASSGYYGAYNIIPLDSLKSGAVYLYENDESTGSCNMITVDSKGEKKKLRVDPIDYLGSVYFNGDILSYGGHIYKYDLTTEELNDIYSLDLNTSSDLIVSNSGETIYYKKDGYVYCARDVYGNGKKYEETEIGMYDNYSNLVLLKDRYLLFSLKEKIYISDNGGEPVETRIETPSFLYDKKSESSINYTYVNSMVYSEYYSRYESDIYILKPNGESELVAANGKK